MSIINHRKVFFVLSAVLMIGSVLAMYAYGFNLGIDFKGGSILEVSYESTRPSLESVRSELDNLDLGSYILTPTGERNYTLKTREITLDEKTSILGALSKDSANPPKEEKFNSIGPVVGNQLKNKALIAIVIVIICIVLFITFAFRKVSHPVASWKYGLATIVALAHDVIIPTGIFVAWIHFHGGQIDLLFVTALLAILGYSVHDTIVVFDRVRENLRSDSRGKPARPHEGIRSGAGGETFVETVGRSITQTFGRSINTSLTIFLALSALYFIGGESTRDFAFVLLVGVIAGTYSSIFVASPLLVTLEKLQKNK